jgi:hypothetical protein
MARVMWPARGLTPGARCEGGMYSLSRARAAITQRLSISAGIRVLNEGAGTAGVNYA